MSSLANGASMTKFPLSVTTGPAAIQNTVSDML